MQRLDEVLRNQQDPANGKRSVNWATHAKEMIDQEYWLIKQAIRLACELREDWPGPFTTDRYAEPITDSERELFTQWTQSADGEYTELEEQYWRTFNRTERAIKQRELAVLDPIPIELTAEQRHTMIDHHRSRIVHKMDCRVKPKDYINWLAAAGMKVPTEFAQLITKKKNPGREKAALTRRDSTYLGYLVLIEKYGIETYNLETSDGGHSLNIARLAQDLEKHRDTILDTGSIPLSIEVATRQFKKMCRTFVKTGS